MNSLYSSEISLRAAIISAKKNTSNPEEFTNNIKIHALNQIELVEKAEGLINGVKSADSIQKAAITAAIGGLQLAYKTISLGFEEAQSKRRQFIDECDKHLSTFIMNNNKEPTQFSPEELAIKHFYQFLQKRGHEFIEYSGIELKELDAYPNTQFFSILPFFKMSQALPHHRLISSKLDEYRQSIYHFLQSGLPLRYYYQKFISANSFFLKINALFAPENYLNYYRAPRFIVTALANLLWNLQHPVNIENGTPISTAEAVTLCYNAEMLLNDLLNPRQFPFLELIDSKSKRLSQCLYRMELNIKGLKHSFEYEHLHEINLKDVSEHMHSALTVMSNKMLELIYQDEMAAEHLISLVMTMSTLFLHHPTLFEHFNSLVNHPLPPQLNSSPCTIVDILMLFSMLHPKKRLQFCQALINTNLEPETHLAFQLREFHKTFLSPFEDKAIPDITKLHPEKNQYTLCASYFLPLLVLVMESFTVFKDTRPHKNDPLSTSYHDADKSSHHLLNSKNDKKQAQLILDSLMEAEQEDSYYHWSISMFFKFKSKHHHSINQLLVWQNEIRHNTAKLDEYADLISKNRLCLQSASLRQNLILFLSQVCDLFTTLDKNFGTIASQMQTNSKIHRDEKRVLHPMLDDLETIVSSIQKSIQQVNTIISAPDFDAEERQRNSENNSLLQQYQTPLAKSRSPLAQESLKPKELKLGLQSSIKSPGGEKQTLFSNAMNTHIPEPQVLKLKLEPHIHSHKPSPETPISAKKHKEEDVYPFQELLLYGIEACMGIASLVFAVNCFTPFLAIHLTLSMTACFIGLATTIALGLYHYYGCSRAQETIFHFQTPAY